MKYVVEMALCGMIYIPNFIRIGSVVQTLLGGGGDKHTATRYLSIL
jgi:hypothetical protein